MAVSRSLAVALQKILDLFLHPLRILDLNFPQLEILLLELLDIFLELCELFLELDDPVLVVEMVVLYFAVLVFELAVLFQLDILFFEPIDHVLELSGWSTLYISVSQTSDNSINLPHFNEPHKLTS